MLVLSISCNTSNKPQVAEIAPSPKTCSDHQFCAPLRTYEEKCRTSSLEEDCAKFVENFEKLSTRNDCQRSFDTGPVPSVWVCDEDSEEDGSPKIFERSAGTLSKLKYSFAKKFYGSEKFRSTLDGDVAEEHLKPSMEIEKSSASP